MAQMGRPRGMTSEQNEKIRWVHECMIRDRVLLSDTDARNHVQEYLEEGGYKTLSVSGLTSFMRQVRRWSPTDEELRMEAIAGLRMAESMAREQEDNANLARIEEIRLRHLSAPVDKASDELKVAVRLDKSAWEDSADEYEED